MTAGINPIAFENMTIDEILCVIYGYQERMKFEAMQTYMLPGLISRALSGKDYPQPQEVFPGLLEAPEQQPQWEIWKARIMSHSEDYLRNRGDKS